MKRCFKTIFLLFPLSSLASCQKVSEIINEEFILKDFKTEYVLHEEIDISTIKIEALHKDGSKTYSSILKKEVTGLENATESIGIKTLNLHHNKLETNINICVYYPGDKYNEEFRSQYHYSKYFGWINDPNGLVYNAFTKEYHMYYQDGPRMGSNAANFWSNRSWGHAVSNDMIHWQEQPGYAIYPQADGFGDIWSGCCVVDKENTSGLFPDYINKEERIIAIYSVTRAQQQYCLAYSLDGGYTFEKYKKNPIINNSSAQFGGGFRDSKCEWIKDSSKPNGGYWLLITAGESGARLFTSDNLLTWKFNSFVRDKDGTIIGYECPMCIPMAVDGDKNNIKYVVSLGGTSYYIGSLITNSDGLLEFKCESEKMVFNSGRNMYATQNWTLDDGRVILTSWISDYYMQSNPNTTPDRIWEGMMSIPFEAKLKTDTYGNLRLYTYPVHNLDVLRGDELFSGTDFEVNTSTSNILEGIFDNTFEIETELELKEDQGRVGFILRKSGNEYVNIYYDIFENELVVDQSKTRATTYTDKYVINKPKDNKIKLKIYVDVSAIDVSINDGEGSISTIYFLPNDNQQNEFYVDGTTVNVNKLDLYHLRSIYHKEC